MRVRPNPTIAGHDHGIAIAGRGDDHLIGGIAVKRGRKPTAFLQNGAGELDQLQSRARTRRVQPVREGPIEDELTLLDPLGDLPD